ncbi:hypothetical protein ACN47E_008237 [Coniothyrium glycines]
MQTVDSRRGIAKAENISKLTKLAFVFIPLSFVASLFSMQIHELERGLFVSAFVLVAFGFVMIAYAIRLSIRSSRIVKYKNDVLSDVHDDDHLQNNQPIPTYVFLVLAWGELRSSISKSLEGLFIVFAPIVLVA